MYWLLVHSSLDTSNLEDDFDNPSGVKSFINSSLVKISSSVFEDHPSNAKKFVRASGSTPLSLNPSTNCSKVSFLFESFFPSISVMIVRCENSGCSHPNVW
jgi:hypothetical protein